MPWLATVSMKESYHELPSQESPLFCQNYQSRRPVSELSITLGAGETLRRCKFDENEPHFFKCKKTSRKQYCCHACVQKAYYHRHRPAPKPIQYVDSEPCLQCQKIVPTTRPWARLWCSPACRQKAYRERKALNALSPLIQFQVAAK
jgi:hypothetical protein